MKEMIIILILHLMILLWDLLWKTFFYGYLYLTYYDQKSINLEYDIKHDYSKDSPRKRNFFSNSMVINGNGFEIKWFRQTCLGAVKSESTFIKNRSKISSGDLGPDSTNSLSC